METLVEKIELGRWWKFKLYSLESTGGGFENGKKDILCISKSRETIFTQQSKLT